MAGSLLPLLVRAPLNPSNRLFTNYPSFITSSSSSSSSLNISLKPTFPSSVSKLNLSLYNPSLNRRLKPNYALDSDTPFISNQGSEKIKNSQEFEEWDSLTAKFAGASNLPFLLLQLPQIILNSQNLIAGDYSALSAVPWLGMLTGLLGNVSLLSYFAKKKETEAIVVQTLGVISTYVVIVQLAMAGSMPLPFFIVTSAVVAAGLSLNFMNYFNWLHPGIWLFWEDLTTVGGLSVLPQVMWSTFVPYIPNSILPGSIAFVMAITAVIMARTGRLSEKNVKTIGSLSGWTATLLFMWMPIAQMWTSYLKPENIKGLSAISMLLAMIGNGLMIPRALFIRDLMWFTGSSWASVLHGWGNLVCMYCFNSISKEFFLAATLGLYTWIGIGLWKDTKVYGFNSPLRSLKELLFGP
ncbi:maltose excess protein 1-like, chloroplastic isoform X1 [Papaver somniferum]|uniref:maltose excess protein 1-like, chloroplastic isoform X1 n=1 Tax=Papaver somniferum TaxID=3469 RepID=UPI000E70529F|nr:maltose excess protein 1-like, chloroplastic isoform X1 [Papaver somniferum]